MKGSLGLMIIRACKMHPGVVFLKPKLIFQQVNEGISIERSQNKCTAMLT
jgi:hypothetical protein